MPESAILQITNLSKNFGHFHALKSVSLTVNASEIYALIGPNGSGKTTLVNNIVGLLKPDQGSIHIGSVDISQKPESAKSLFGYIPDSPSNYLYLTGIEFLEMTARVRSISKTVSDKRILELIRVFPLHDIFEKRMETYSRGNIQKIAFLAALIDKTKLLVIDEPIVGLDPVSIKIFGDTLRAYIKNGGSVFLSTHTLSFAEKYADRVGVLNQGKLVYESSNLNNLEHTYIKYTQVNDNAN